MKTIIRRLARGRIFTWGVAALLGVAGIIQTANAQTTRPISRPAYLDPSKSIDDRINDLLSRLTLEEKVSLCHANGTFTTAGVPRLGIPQLVMDDGPLGVREDVGDNFAVLNKSDDFITAMPAPEALAASWSLTTAKLYGQVIGQEALHRGKNVMLGPAMNIQRTPLCGRNFEYMGEDPYLASRIAINYIEGEQGEGVSSCAKHFAANSQETARNRINEIIDLRTLHEIYLPAFKASVQEAQVLCVMGAYNQINGQFCCENDWLLNQTLKGDWGFKGLVMSDWGGTHTTDGAALHGLDMEMGSRVAWLGDAFLQGLQSGQYPVSVVDEKVRRHLYVMFKLNLIGEQPSQPAAAAEKGEVNTVFHQQVAKYVENQGSVLLKNDGDLLPLDPTKLKTIAIIGANANYKFAHSGNSAQLKAFYEVTALEGIVNRVNRPQSGGNFVIPPPAAATGRRSGAPAALPPQPAPIVPALHVAVTYAEGYTMPTGARGGRRGEPGTAPANNADADLLAQAVNAAKQADVVIYVGGLTHANGFDVEGSDRRDLTLPGGQDQLISAIADANPNTIVVLTGGDAVTMPWLDKVKSVLWTWYPGMEGGNAIAELLFGDINPSGKLPCTFPKQLSDSPAHALDAYPGNGSTVEYKEGVLVGYRWFDTKQIEPLFPFGFGLSYTKFDYANLKLAPATGNSPTGPLVTATCDVTNTGQRDGEEVVELYVHPVNAVIQRPEKELKGFSKIVVLKGQKATASIPLTRSAFEYYDPDKKMWVGDAGDYEIEIGASSRDIRLKGTFTLKAAISDKD